MGGKRILWEFKILTWQREERKERWPKSVCGRSQIDLLVYRAYIIYESGSRLRKIYGNETGDRLTNRSVNIEAAGTVKKKKKEKINCEFFFFFLYRILRS